MKTNLPEKISTIKQAKSFLTELHKNGEAFHPEDNAHDIAWNSAQPTKEECDKLNQLMSDIYNLPGNFDPCDHFMDLVEAGK